MAIARGTNEIMAIDKKQRQEKRIRSLASSFLKRGRDWLEISVYSVGDIQTEKNLYVSPKGCVVGQVNAPRLVVSGIVFGHISCREVIVEPGGQIWGDILAASMEIGPGGKLHGWFSALDEGTIDLLRTGDLDRGDLRDPAPGPMRADILTRFPELETVSLNENGGEKEEMSIRRQLQAEAALATVARAEIEAAFERRVNEAIMDFESQARDYPRFEEQDKSHQAGNSSPPIESEVDSVDQRRVDQLQNELQKARLELHRRQALLNRVTAQAKTYHSRYLWAKANLDSAKKALAEYRGVSAVNFSAFIDLDGTDIASSSDEIALSLARNEQIAELRSQLVERDIDIENMEREIRNLDAELKKTVRIATQRIRELEGRKL